MNKKLLLAVPLMAIAVITIGLIEMSSNVFAQTATSTAVDPKDQNDSQTGDQTAKDAADSNNDGETNDDHGAQREGPNGDGETKDSAEPSTGADKDNLQQ